MRTSHWSLLLAFAASLTLAGPARAYVRTVSGGKNTVYWSNPHIKMTVLTGGMDIVPADELVAAATRAAATWSDPMLGSTIEVSIEASSDPHVDTDFDHMDPTVPKNPPWVNTISFKTASWDDGVTYFREQLALTTLWNVGGRIVDADTEINGFDPAYPWATLPDDPAAAASAPQVDLVAAVTHEMGHVVGLDHPCVLGEPVPGETTNTGAVVPSCSDPDLPASVKDATMYPSAVPGSIQERTLSDDEKKALHDIYPDSGGGCAVGAGAPSTTWAAGLFSLAALLVARRQRARARR